MGPRSFAFVAAEILVRSGRARLVVERRPDTAGKPSFRPPRDGRRPNPRRARARLAGWSQLRPCLSRTALARLSDRYSRIRDGRITRANKSSAKLKEEETWPDPVLPTISRQSACA